MASLFVGWVKSWLLWAIRWPMAMIHSFPKNIVADFGPRNGSSYGCRPYLMTKSVTIYFKHGFWRIVNSTARYTFDKTIFEIFVLFLGIQAVFRNPTHKPQIPVEALGLSLPPRLTDQSSFWVRFKSNTKRKDYLNTVCDPSLYCIQGNKKILPLPEIYNRLKEIVHINLAYDTGPQVDTPLSSLKMTVFSTMGRKICASSEQNFQNKYDWDWHTF